MAAPQADTVCVVIGASPAERVQAKVLEHSIRSRSTDPGSIEIVHTMDRKLPRLDSHQGTPFSLVRWWIPELRGFRGRAIYFDSDMIAYGDVRELWNTPMAGRAVLSTPQPAVLLIDCERVGTRWKIEDLIGKVRRREMSYRDLMQHFAGLPLEEVGPLPEEWNHTDHFEPGRTKLLHFTNLATQPWGYPAHPLGVLWYRELQEAIRESAVPIHWLDKLPPWIAEKKLFQSTTGDLPPFNPKSPPPPRRIDPKTGCPVF